jgi:hypothetical protein
MCHVCFGSDQKKALPMKEGLFKMVINKLVNRQTLASESTLVVYYIDDVDTRS